MYEIADGLQLRFRTPVHDDEDADVAAFAQPIPPTMTGVEQDPIAVLPGSDPRASLDTLVVFFELAAFGIPRIGVALREDIEDFCLRATVFGYVAAVPRSPAARQAGRTWIMAACLPLALVSPEAWAAAPTPPKLPEVQRAVPEPAPKAEAEPASTETPAEPGDRIPTIDPSETPPPATCPDPAESPGESALHDAAWEGVVGYDVELTLVNKGTLRGRVTAVQPNTFTLIERDSGIVRVLQRHSVKQLRVDVGNKIPSQDGTGLLAGGGILTAVGVPTFIAGVVFVAVCPSCTYIHLPLLIIGGAAIGGGIPMIVKGARRRTEYNEAKMRRWAVRPSFGRTKYGWSGGLRMRF